MTDSKKYLFLKLVTGEEMVGRLVHNEPDSITLEHPAFARIGHDQLSDEQGYLYFETGLWLSDSNNAKINNRNVIYSSNVDETVIDAYEKFTKEADDKKKASKAKAAAWVDAENAGTTRDVALACLERLKGGHTLN